jgi:membrane associated rhomboid family serine protease/tetratricopeptide (TPR) repeat protein
LFQRLRAAPVSTTIFAICIVVFAIAERDGSTKSIPTLLKFGATSRELVWQGEYWRLFTSMFLHIGAVHLIWNIVAGFSWTAPFERVMRPVRFLVIYLLSGLAGSAVSVIGHDAVAAGASGALFGVIGGVIVLQRKALGSWSALWAQPEIRRNLVMMLIWLGIGPIAGFDSFAHLGGLLAGAALTWTLVPMHWGNFGAAVAAVALTVWVSLRPMPGLHDDWFAVERARVAFEKSDWEAVIHETDTLAVKTEPRLALYRAVALISLNRPAEAMSLLPSVSLNPVGNAVMRAEVHSGLAKYDEALEDLRVGLEDSPEQVMLLRMKIRVLLLKGDTAKADEVASELALIAPADHDVRALQAKVLLATRRPEKALDLLNELRAQTPGGFSPEYIEALIVLGRYDEARAALPAEKMEANTKEQLSCYLEASAGEFEAATKACANEKNLWLIELRAAIAAAKGDCDPARKLFTNAPRTRFNEMISASCFIKEQQWKKATELVDKLLETDPLDLEVLLLKASLVRGDQGYDEVMKKLEGREAQATHSLMWQLLTPEMKEALPRR